MPFSELKGQPRALEVLRRLTAGGGAGRRPSTLVFTGPEGSGRFLAARLFGEALLCPNTSNNAKTSGSGGCGVCAVCHRIRSGLHPDFRVVRPPAVWDPPLWPLPKSAEQSTEIVVDQTRALAQEAEFKPYEGPVKLFVLDPADTMRRAAANALLKLLEEPPPATYLILIAASKKALLPTLASRCIEMPLRPLPPAVADELLAARLEGCPPDERALRLRLADGNLGEAEKIDPEKWRAGLDEALALLAAPAGEKSARLRAIPFGRDAQRAFAEALRVAVNECVSLKAGRPNRLLFPENAPRYVQALAATPEPEMLAAILSGLSTFRDLNLNLRMHLEGRFNSAAPLDDPWLDLD